MTMKSKFKLPNKFSKKMTDAMPKKKVAMGWFYKDNLEEGWSWYAHKAQDPGMWAGMEKIEQVAEDYCHQAEIVNWYKADPQGCIDSHFEGLREAIADWNVCQNGNPSKRSWTHEFDSHNADNVSAFTRCVLDIKFLTHVGALEQDNYNGTTYAYAG